MESKVNSALTLFPLLSAAGIEAALRDPEFIVNDGQPGPADSIDFLNAFAKKFPEIWKPFEDELGSDCLEGLSDFQALDEMQAVPFFSEELKAQITEEERELRLKHKPPMTQPVYDAMRQTTKEAKEANIPASAGRMMQILLQSDCNARAFLLTKVSSQVLDSGIAKIPIEPGEVLDPQSQFQKVREGMGEVLEKAWPQIRGVADTERSIAFKEKHFAENPAYYEGRVNLAEHLKKPILDPKNEFSQRSGGCLHAAQNEARLRKAPEVTLDHMFFSLLQEGLVTTAFLESRGIDWQAWRSELDDAIPTFDGEGVRFPPNARNLGMNWPEDRVLPPMPNWSELFSQGRSDEWNEVLRNREKQAKPRKFSDLLWLVGCLKEPKTLAYEYLSQAGITIDDVKAVLDN